MTHNWDSTMPDTDKTVFISYRRNVASFIARAVFMDLRANGYDAFMDVESINAGEFDHIILNQIAARAHFLVILTPGSIERCTEPGDWLRREIEEAMRLQRNIVPLLCNGFTFNTKTKSYLTGDLERLSKFNSLPIYVEYFDEGMARLRNRFLKQQAQGTIVPTPVAELAIVEEKIQQAATVDTIVVPGRYGISEDLFLRQNRWSAVRIHDTMIPLLKYVALYQTAPLSAVTHVAPIASIEPLEGTEKSVINFSGEAEAISPIPLIKGKRGRIKTFPRFRYTTLEKLKAAKTLDDIFPEVKA
jgi:hypothetical protein